MHGRTSPQPKIEHFDPTCSKLNIKGNNCKEKDIIPTETFVTNKKEARKDKETTCTSSC